MGLLSGANQQEVVLAKWLATNLRVLIVDEPTRGVDVGTKVEIYAQMRELAAEGLAIADRMHHGAGGARARRIRGVVRAANFALRRQIARRSALAYVIVHGFFEVEVTRY